MEAFETYRDPRICLIWARQQGSLLTTLSLNITREICLYLQPFLHLVWVTKHSLTYFDFECMAAKPAINLKTRISINSDSRWTIAGSDLVAICGCGTEWRNTYLLHESGEVQSLPLTSYEHQACGVIAWRRALFVFGSFCSPGKMKCESLSLTQPSAVWKPIADMQRDRSFFTPTQWQIDVYLCGGWNNTTVEICDGHNMRMASIVLPEGCSSISCVYDGQLLVFTHNFLVVVSVGNHTSVKRHNLGGIHPCVSPTIHNRRAFCYNDAGAIVQYSTEDGSSYYNFK